MFWFMTFLSANAVANNASDAIEQKQQADFQEISVHTTNLEDGVTGVTGSVYIAASPKHVWAAITDYNNHKYFVPKLIDSGLISDNGREQVMFERGKTDILFFRKTVYIKLSLQGEYPKRLDFRQLEGDFKVYEGKWLLEKAPDGKGTLLTFNARIKPDFFAPAMFVSKVQKHDLPMVLAAMKKRAESSLSAQHLVNTDDLIHTPEQQGLQPVVD
ncbi:MAG: SRPBCC family protein [Chlorobiaceae bacterium]|nr:SRPBCC family protein [Chlorobiaceae bacterium]